MTSPFTIFRRHQKVFLAALALLAMISFVFLSGPVFDSLTSHTMRNPLVVSTKTYGNLTEADLAHLIRQQNLVRSFFERVYLTMGFRLPWEPPSEESAVETWILANRAKELGMVISNSMINAYLREMTGGRISRETFRQILQEMHLSDRQLFDALRTELAARQMLEMIDFSTLPTTPAQRWDYYQRLNRRATVELVAEPVAKYVDRVGEPEEAALRDLFEKYKENYYDPASPEPGFRRPHRAALEYLKADVAQFMQPASITEAEIQQYYEKNKDTYYLRSKLPPVEKTLPKSGPTEPKRSPEGQPETSAQPTPKTPQERPPESKPDEKPPSEKPPAPKPPAEKNTAEKTPPDNQAPEKPSAGKPSEKPSEEKTGTGESKPTGSEPPKAEKSGSEKPAPEKAPQDKPAASPPATQGTSGVWQRSKSRFALAAISEDSEKVMEEESAFWMISAESETPVGEKPASEKSGAAESAGSASKAPTPIEKPEKKAEKSASSGVSAAERSPGAAPTASSPSAPQGSPSKPTPAGEKTQAPSAAETGPPKSDLSAAGAKEPSPPPEASKYVPLEEVKEEIREALARGKAQAKIEQMLQKIRDQMNNYALARLSTPPGAQPPTPLDLQSLAKQHGIQYRKTPLISEWQFRRDYRDIAQAQIGGRSSVIQFLYYQGRPPFQATLAQDLDAYYLFWKVEDAKEAIPSWDYSEADRLEKEAEKARQEGKEQEAASLAQQAQRTRKETDQLRQEVLRAWKMIQARSLARNQAAQFAALARNTGKSLQEALAKEPGVTVLEAGPFSWLTHGAVSPRLFLQAPPPRISSIPQVEMPGEEFMETVFRMEPGQVEVAFNQPKTVAYVIRVKSFEPSWQVLWAQFVSDRYEDYSSAAVFDQQKIRAAWMEHLKQQIGFRWERKPYSGSER